MEFIIEPIMKSFKVTLENQNNPGRFKFITVDECKDMDECIDHIWNTEPGWTIDAIKQL